MKMRRKRLVAYTGDSAGTYDTFLRKLRAGKVRYAWHGPYTVGPITYWALRFRRVK